MPRMAVNETRADKALFNYISALAMLTIVYNLHIILKNRDLLLRTVRVT
jgi:hypothetical protein